MSVNQGPNRERAVSVQNGWIMLVLLLGLLLADIAVFVTAGPRAGGGDAAGGHPRCCPSSSSC